MISEVITLPSGRANSNAASDSTDTKHLDEQLIARIAAGNRLAMRVLFARYNQRVFRFALRLLQSESLAEEVVSEVFFDVWRKASTFEGRAQVSTWLLGITRNKALDARKGRSTETWDEDAALAVEDPAANPEVEYQQKDTRAVMRKCLAQLSATHREIIDLVYYHGKSIDEVARITGAGQATVKTRMFYARKHLAELLGAYGITTAAA
jgi:RNA polymerase sigma-70 factor (ECF subfamily)